MRTALQLVVIYAVLGVAWLISRFDLTDSGAHLTAERRAEIDAMARRF